MVKLIKPLFVAWMLSFASVGYAGERLHNRVGFNGALTSSDSWQLEFSYHYMFNRCIGLGGSAGAWKVYYEDGWASGRNWEIDSDDNKPSNLYLRPSLVLKTPAIKRGECSWSLFAEPGVMLNVPYQRVCVNATPEWPRIDYDYISTHRGQWLAFDLRLGISLDVEDCGISVGYMMSDLDVYSQYRHLSYKGTSFRTFYPRKPFMQGGYISLSYNF